jgi:hypothetical protein
MLNPAISRINWKIWIKIRNISSTVNRERGCKTAELMQKHDYKKVIYTPVG